MRGGWVNTTPAIRCGAERPARLEMESGLDRRFFIIDIEMTADKEMEYKGSTATGEHDQRTTGCSRQRILLYPRMVLDPYV